MFSWIRVQQSSFLLTQCSDKFFPSSTDQSRGRRGAMSTQTKLKTQDETTDCISHLSASPQVHCPILSWAYDVPLANAGISLFSPLSKTSFLTSSSNEAWVDFPYPDSQLLYIKQKAYEFPSNIIGPKFPEVWSLCNTKDFHRPQGHWSSDTSTIRWKC